ncbi:MAG TPA: hypothetical protein VKP61_17160 [Candidatus Acidoferrum sp.]|nr:hypothetical protein [Candidatus Acidoferrum sp.]
MVLHTEAAKYCGSAGGGSQAQIIKSSDAKYFVVKAPNNPQGIRTLANEMLGSLILRRLGIPTPEPAIVQVHPWLVSRTVEMKLAEDGHVEPWQPGLCFGSRIDTHGWYPISLCPFKDELYDHQIASVANLDAFKEVLMFDLWAVHLDPRQSVFVRPVRGSGFVATMIDQGFCFGGERWDLTRKARACTFRQPQVYDSVYGMDAFEPIIKRMRRKLNLQSLRKLADDIPNEWLDDRDQFDAMLRLLTKRLDILEELINDLHSRSDNPFRNWEKMPRHRLHSAFGDASFEDEGLIPPLRFEQAVAAD